MAGTIVRIYDGDTRVIIEGSELLAPLVTAAEAAADASQAQLLPAPASTNLYDPRAADAARAHSYSTTTGASVAAATDLAVLGLIPVTPGTTYVLTLKNAFQAWYFRRDMTTYDADGVFAAYVAEGANLSVISDPDRVFSTMTIIVPAGVHFIGLTVGLFPAVAITASDFADLLPLVQMNAGSTVLPFEPFRPAGSFLPGVTIAGPMVAQRDDVFVYVRGPWSAAQDVVEKVLFLEGYRAAGTLTSESTRLIPSWTAAEDTKDAFAASPFVLQIAGDDGPPIWVNNVPLGGGHGIPAKSITATAHGKTNVDVGSRWTDGAAKVWVLAGVTDANTLLISEMPGGTATAWTITETLTGTTLTHSAGATHTGAITLSAPVATFLLPLVQNRACTIWVDDVPLTKDGVVAGKAVTINERYGIPNARSVIDDLIALVGSSAAPAYNRAAIQTQIEVDTAYCWRPGELCRFSYQARNVQAYANGKIVGAQAGAQNLILGDDTIHLYAPGMGAEATTGFTLTAIANVTAAHSLFDLDPAEMLDSSDPPERLAQLIKTAGGVWRHGFLIGFSKRIGAGVAATRSALISAAAEVSPTNKLYPYAVGVRAMAAGDVFNVAGYRGAYDPAAATVNAVYADGDRQVWIIDIHATLSFGWIPLPFALRNALVGKKLTVFQKSGSLTLHSAFIGQRGAQVSTTGGYGYLVAEIG